MKRLLITVACTLGLTLMGTFGSYQNSLNYDNIIDSNTDSTKVEENVTDMQNKTSLISDNISSVQDIETRASAPEANKVTPNTSDKKVLGVSVTKITNDKKLVYKNVDLSKCKTANDVVKVLRKNGFIKINAKNIYKNKSLEQIIANLKASQKNKTKASATKAPAATKTPAKTVNPTKAPEATKTPAKTVNPTKAPEATKTPAKTVNPTKAPEATKTPAKTVNPTKAPEATKTPTKATTQTPTPTKAPTTTTNTSTTTSNYASEVLRLVNVERAKAGLSALSTNTTLSNAANKRAGETVQSFSHTRPNGTSFSTVLAEYGVSYNAAGENIAYGQKTPQEVVNSWMNSSGHRANILSSKFNKVGIGVYQSNGVTYWTQLFTN